MADTVPNDKRAAARQAMEDDAHRAKREEREASLQKRRKQAMLAMEGYEHKIKREQKEQIERTKALAEKRREEEARRKQQEEEEARQREEEAKRATEAEQERLATEHLSQVKQSYELIEELKNKETAINSLRTFKSDIAGAVKDSKISLTQIALKQQGEQSNFFQTQGGAGDNNRRTMRLVAITSLLIVLGILALGLNFFLNREAGEIGSTVATTTTEAIMATEETLVIDTATATPKLLAKIILQAKNTAPRRAEVFSNISLVRNGQPLSWREFTVATEFELPPELNRNLADQYMLGAYKTLDHSDLTSNIFYILKTIHYDEASALMLANENSVIASLMKPLIEKPIGKELAEKNFKDRVVSNVDTRALLNDAGQVLVLYGFPDKNTLVIAPNELVFKKIVSLLSLPKPAAQ